MNFRLRAASRVALFHLLISVIASSAILAFIFFTWFPSPYDAIIGPFAPIAITVLSVSVIGPVLSLFLFSPTKESWKWRIDLVIIVLVQLTTLAFGLTAISSMRPVFLAFEGDRFRVVRGGDVDSSTLSNTTIEFRRFALSGPKLIGVKLLGSEDPGFVSSLVAAFEGNHPSFRPERWVDFESQLPALISKSKSLELIPNSQQSDGVIESWRRDAMVASRSLGYFPLVSDKVTDWIVVIDKTTGKPVKILNVDGW